MRIADGIAGLSRKLLLTAAGLFAVAPEVARAHMVTPVTPDNVWSSWNFDPLILLTLTTVVALYVAGVRNIWRVAGRGKGVSAGQVAAFGGGIAVLIVALVSPLDQLGGALFSAHMVQHLLLMLVAPPLLVWAAPVVPMLLGAPRDVRRMAGRLSGWNRARAVMTALRQPLVVGALHVVALWIWHLPSLYEAALRIPWVHTVEHLSFFVTACLFWWIVIQPHGRRTLGMGMAVIFIFTSMMQSTALGALITFASESWYEAHAPYVEAWGISPISDQQLAGLIMWIPAGLIYLVTALVVLAVWLRSVGPAEGERRLEIRVLDSDAGTDRSRSPRSD